MKELTYWLPATVNASSPNIVFCIIWKRLIILFSLIKKTDSLFKFQIEVKHRFLGVHFLLVFLINVYSDVSLLVLLYYSPFFFTNNPQAIYWKGSRFVLPLSSTISQPKWPNYNYSD